MKNENLIYGLSSLIVIVGVVMNFAHIDYGDYVFMFGLLFMLLFQGFHLKQLKKRIQDLEEK